MAVSISLGVLFVGVLIIGVLFAFDFWIPGKPSDMDAK